MARIIRNANFEWLKRLLDNRINWIPNLIKVPKCHRGICCILNESRTASVAYIVSCLMAEHQRSINERANSTGTTKHHNEAWRMKFFCKYAGNNENIQGMWGRMDTLIKLSIFSILFKLNIGEWIFQFLLTVEIGILIADVNSECI